MRPAREPLIRDLESTLLLVSRRRHGGEPDNVVFTEKKQVAVGEGAVDWKKLFAAAKTGGVKNYFVEMNIDALKASYPYLHALSS